ncbi:MAG: hypothetical protein IKX00_02050 [Bacilli bacterium]|nr:hypothetical protein [Bacilli bacterium]
MNNSFENISRIYKPYKYKIIGKVKILNCQNIDIVLKPKNDKLIQTHKYLSSRGFENYVKVQDQDRDNYFIYPYIYENSVPYEQKGNDMAKTVALLHAKTSYFKDIDESIVDKLYLDIDNNIEYVKEYYSKLYDDIFIKKYYSPVEMVFIDIYSKINNACIFCKNELENWYNLSLDKKSKRVALLHNNLKIKHFLKGEEDYLISFDNAKIDTPVLDLVKFYKNEYNNLDFSKILNTYTYHFDLNIDEYKLFFILISIPNIIDISNKDKNNLLEICNLKNYLYKTEELIRPYYSENEEEEKR